MLAICPSMFLRFQSDVNMVPSVRRFAADFCASFLRDEDGVSRVALVAHELLENAAKYALERETTFAIELLSDQGGVGPHVQIRLSNRASPENIALLRRMIADMDANEPLQHYLELMRRTLPSTDSGLGLARIRAEGEMSLSLDVRGDLITLVAEMHA